MIKQRSKREPVWDREEDQKNHIVLSEYSDFKKQYDERSYSHLHNIGERKNCWTSFWKKDPEHNWKNAYLQWRRYDAKKVEWTVDIPSDRDRLIRFCVRCKLIDCIHYWKEKDYKVYEVRHGKRTGYIVVCKCEICGLRICICDCSSFMYRSPDYDKDYYASPAPLGKVKW